jgi:tRNA uridine 5-carboxymethylaminomethyl modification enzyme
LALRHDNADERLRPYGKGLGLVGNWDWERFIQRRDRIAIARAALRGTRLRKRDAAYLAVSETIKCDLGESFSLEELAKRPGITPDIVQRLLPTSASQLTTTGDLEAALADNLYEGYIKAQDTVIRRLKQHDSTPIPAGLDFRNLEGLSHEMVERLERSRPLTFGEARTIPGLTAAALSTLYVAANLQNRVSRVPL